MTMLSTTELATRLGVSKGRVSQYVSAGKLDGCYQGKGRARRFDLAKVGEALGKRLDQGQLMGNGSETRAALRTLAPEDEGATPAPAAPNAPPTGLGASELPRGDSDRYNMARTQKAEEEARKLRRQNAEANGQYVLASTAALQARRQISQEIAEFESVMRDAARRVADELGVDFKSTRAILLEAWRAHREHRAETLTERSASAALGDDEAEEDI
ncbi:hypothetical protein SAMN04490244_101277 [Tranquillimonas rosea]|uniref:Helix-turn-helix domain-containing protein n=2 Tax=Tranquillimonas rosea TaxID=641238 RepID=A0A1H9PR77_9RHOB|nr:hypothetical protein SAMN04490244_101277 [Tranquillimonas rosea]